MRTILLWTCFYFLNYLYHFIRAIIYVSNDKIYFLKYLFFLLSSFLLILILHFHSMISINCNSDNNIYLSQIISNLFCICDQLNVMFVTKFISNSPLFIYFLCFFSEEQLSDDDIDREFYGENNEFGRDSNPFDGNAKKKNSRGNICNFVFFHSHLLLRMFTPKFIFILLLFLLSYLNLFLF